MPSLELLGTHAVGDAQFDGERIWHVSWSPNGSFLATCGEDKMIRIWQCIDIDAWCDSGMEVEGVSGGSNGGGTVAAPAAIRCIATLEDDAQTRTLRCCEWSPDGRMIASASFDGTVVVWESRGAGMLYWEQIASLEGHENEVKCVAWSPCGKWLATCGRDKRVWVWEQLVNSHEFECVSMLEGHTQDVKFVQWHPTEPVLFSASYDDTIRVWHEDGDEFYCAATLTGHASTVWGLCIEPLAGRNFVSCSADASLILWESDGQVWRAAHQLKGAHAQAPIYSLSWSAAHGHILSGAGDNNICLSAMRRDDGLASLELLAACKPQAHGGDVNCVRWNPMPSKSLLAASAGDDGCIKLWRLVP